MKVCVSRRKKGKARRKNGRKLPVAVKLDESQVRWIVREKHKCELTNEQIARTMGISTRWVKKLYERYKDAKSFTYPRPAGRPDDGLYGRKEHAAVLNYRKKRRRYAVRLARIIRMRIGIHIPHHTIHKILRDEELAENQPKKAKQRKWVRYERRHSNSLWHTDYKLLRDGRWFLAFQDDASRLIVGFGVFDEATAEHTLEVLDESIKRYGKPAAILTDYGTQFYANEAECRVRGASRFEKRLVELDIRHILARVNHPQTNGKLERFHREIEQHLESFEEESSDRTVRGVKPGDHVGDPFHLVGMTDPMTRLVEWYNNCEHMSLKDGLETPAEAYVRKMPPKGEVADD